MLLRQTPADFRTFFLLEFTKQLIRHSKEGEEEIFGLKETLKEEAQQKKKVKKKIKDIEKRRVKQVLKGERPLEKSDLEIPTFRPVAQLQAPRQQRVLKVPAPKLPKHLEYLKPTSTSNIQLELGKLDSFIQDATVKDIECNGSDQNIVVKGTMGVKKTNVLLTKEEVDEIIKKFSEAAKTPVKQGFFKVTIGKLDFSAVVSEITGSRFIIKKVMYNPRVM